MGAWGGGFAAKRDRKQNGREGAKCPLLTTLQISGHLPDAPAPPYRHLCVSVSLSILFPGAPSLVLRVNWPARRASFLWVTSCPLPSSEYWWAAPVDLGVFFLVFSQPDSRVSPAPVHQQNPRGCVESCVCFCRDALRVICGTAVPHSFSPFRGFICERARTRLSRSFVGGQSRFRPCRFSFFS